MTEDVLRAFGFLCLGSRFRRLGERLQAETQAMIDALGVSIQAGQYPFLAAIDRFGSMTTGELAEVVGITQPGATRTLAQLTELGLVEARAADEDQRRKLMSLTPAGRHLVAFSKQEVWPRVEAAVRDLCGDLPAQLLQQLTVIEEGLASASLLKRMKDRQETTL